MTLAEVAAATSTDELRAARVLLHVAGQRRRGDRQISEPPYPPLLAAACLELSAELARRGETFGPCPPCVATVRGIVQPAQAG